MVSKIRWFALLFALAITMLSVSYGRAAIVTIDNFNNVASVNTANSGTDPSTSATNDGASMGGERDVYVDWISGSDVTVEINSGGSLGVMSYSSASGTSGRATITWDGDDNDPATLDANGLCSPTCADLTDGSLNTAIRIRVVSNDLASTLHLRLYDGTPGTGTDYLEYALALPGGITSGEPVDFIVPFTSFTIVAGGANANDVGAIQIFFNQGTPTAELDVAIDFTDAIPTLNEWGDLPDTYGTSSGASGPNHGSLSPIRLGNRRDSESDGAPSVGADGDDATIPSPNIDDEDGVVIDTTTIGPWNSTNGGTLQITKYGCSPLCRVNGWIDWNNDGDFGDSLENVIVDSPQGAGLSFHFFPIPPTFPGTNNDVYARFRVCAASASCNTPTGTSPVGEVEDYLWDFSPTAVGLASQNVEQVNDPAGTLLVTVLALGLVTMVGYTFIARRQAKSL